MVGGFSKKGLAFFGITFVAVTTAGLASGYDSEASVVSESTLNSLQESLKFESIPVISGNSAPSRQLASKKPKKSKKSVRKSRKSKPKSSKRTASKISKRRGASKSRKSKKSPKKSTRKSKIVKSKKSKAKKSKANKSNKRRSKVVKSTKRKPKTTKGKGKKSTRKTKKRIVKGKSTKRRGKGKKSKKTGKKGKKSTGNFDRVGSWFKLQKSQKPVKVEAKTTVVRTIQPKADSGKSKKKKIEKVVTTRDADGVDITDERIVITGAEDGFLSEAEPYKEYFLREESVVGGKPVIVETKTEVHHHLREEPNTDEFTATFYEDDETVRQVNELTDTKEAKLVAMLIESAAESAAPLSRQSLEAIRVLKYSKSDRRDCPNVTTTTGWCSAVCGAGERYKFKLWWDAEAETCKKETLVQDCVVVSGCELAEDKWSILQVNRPDYLPAEAFTQLAMMIPEESKWKRDVTTDGYVFYSFRTDVSARFCPFSGAPMDDDECGIAYRYYYTQFLDATGDSIVARGGFDRLPDIISCETPDGQQQLTQRQQDSLLAHFLDEYVSESDEAGPILSSLQELRIAEYQVNELHPMCPSIATTQSSCSSNGCGHGRKYSLTSRYSPITEVCQTLRQEPCLLVSGCVEAAAKWALLEVEKPDRVPASVFLQLADAIPAESEWEKVRTKKGNVLRVGFGFATPWSPRFSPSGEMMDSEECGAAQRWRYVRDYSQEDDAILQDFVVADATIPCPPGYAKSVEGYTDESQQPRTVEEVVPIASAYMDEVPEEVPVATGSFEDDNSIEQNSQ